MTRIVAVGIALLVAQLLAACDSKPVANAAAPAPPAVTVARPLQKTITEWDIFTGRFTAVRSV
jgi:multidrug efflux system membrane fusion protein